MIQSMTGYGKATATFGDKKINVEIKCKFPILGYPLLDGRQSAPV